MPEYFLRKSQLAGALETTPGTIIDPITEAHVKLKPLSDGFSYESTPMRFENQEVADDIGASADVVTAVQGTMSIPLTLKNSGVAGTAPAVGIYLQACGLKEEQVREVAYDNLAVAFVYGETFVSGGTEGIVDKAISAGTGTLRYILTTGDPLEDADSVVGDIAGRCDANGDTAALGWKYSPTTTDQKTITLQRGVANTDATPSKDWIQVLKGAMGTFTIDAEALNAARINFSFQGCEASAGLGAVETGMTFESVATADLPKFINATVTVNDITVRPTSVSFDMGNEIILEPDPSSSGGTDGYDFARVSARAPQITLDPRTIDLLDDHALLRSGDVIAFDLKFGGVGQTIQIITTSAQVRDVSFGDRSGFQTSDKTLAITRHATLTDEDFRIYFT